MKFQPPRGTRDLLPETLYPWRVVVERLLDVSRRYGFRQVETPAFESIELFELKSGPAIREQIYTLTDKGGRTLGLRSDLTPALSRVVANHANAWPKPIKLSVYDRVWRYEAPQAGRYREIHHVNAEMFGVDVVPGDAEIVACFIDAYAAVGLPDIAVLVGHRGLLQVLLRSFDVPEPRLDDVIRVLDKWGKVSESALVDELVLVGTPSSAARQLLDIAQFEDEPLVGLERLARLCPADPLIATELAGLETLFRTLDAYGVTDRLRLRPGLARGFDYYTGVLFECLAPVAARDFGAIGGGGRYDTLVETYGAAPLPAVGYALGVDRIVLVLEHLGRLPADAVPKLDYVVIPSADVTADVVRVVQRLRKRGSVVDLAPPRRSVKKQLEAAYKRGALSTIVVNDDGILALRGGSGQPERLVLDEFLERGEGLAANI